MTKINDRQSTLLRRALAANGIFSLVSGASLAAGSYLIGPEMGIEPAWILIVVGLGLIAFGLGLLRNAGRKIPDLTEARAAVIGDVGWVLGSSVLLVFDPLDLSAAGFAVVIGVAIVVADFALFQTLGLRRAHRA